MTSRRWRCARGSADQPLAHCAESAAHIRPVSGRQAELALQTACLIKAGTLLNIWLYFHHGTHALRVLGVESSVCWIYGWTRRLTVPAGACTHACIAARLRVIPGMRAPHAVLLGTI
jgi:hypothetical protein